MSTIFFVTLAPRFWSLHFQNFATIVFFRVNDAIEKQLETGKVLSVDLAMVPGNLSRLPFYQEFKLITSLSEYLFGARTFDRFGPFPLKKKFKWKNLPGWDSNWGTSDPQPSTYLLSYKAIDTIDVKIDFYISPQTLGQYWSTLVLIARTFSCSKMMYSIGGKMCFAKLSYRFQPLLAQMGMIFLGTFYDSMIFLQCGAARSRIVPKFVSSGRWWSWHGPETWSCCATTTREWPPAASSPHAGKAS